MLHSKPVFSQLLRIIRDIVSKNNRLLLGLRAGEGLRTLSTVGTEKRQKAKSQKEKDADSVKVLEKKLKTQRNWAFPDSKH